MVVLTFTGPAVADRQPLAAAVEIVRREPGPRAAVVPALAGVPERLDQVIRFVSEGRAPAARALVGRIAQRHRDLVAKIGGGASVQVPQLNDAIDAAFAEIDEVVRACARAQSVSPELADAIHASGPQLGSRLFAAALEQSGIPAAWIDATQLVVTEGDHGRATPVLAAAERIGHALGPVIAEGRVPILAGSVGASAAGVTMTMGAGRANLSAAVVAAGTGAYEIHVWGDCDGITAAEPSIVRAAHTVPQLSFAEARELASAGGATLDVATIDVAIARGTPVRIRNVRRPEHPGTVVNGKASAIGCAPAALVCRRPETVLQISPRQSMRDPAFMRRVLDICEEHQADPVLSLTSSSAVIAAFRDNARVDGIAAAAGEFADVTSIEDLALLSAVGEGLTVDSRLAGEVVGALGDVTLHAVVQHPSGRALSVLLDEADAAAAVARVYERFFGAGAGAEACRSGRPEPL